MPQDATPDVIPAPITVDALFLANAAETPGGLLYSLGGGWTRCWPSPGQKYPFERPISIVLMIRIPWGQANREHEFTLSVRDGEERSIVRGGEPATGKFKVGRDVNLLDGMSQLATVAFNAPAELAIPGIYHVVIELNGTEAKRIQFEALDGPPR